MCFLTLSPLSVPAAGLGLCGRRLVAETPHRRQLAWLLNPSFILEQRLLLLRRTRVELPRKTTAACSRLDTHLLHLLAAPHCTAGLRRSGETSTPAVSDLLVRSTPRSGERGDGEDSDHQ